jgi:hypothetical protein
MGEVLEGLEKTKDWEGSISWDLKLTLSKASIKPIDIPFLPSLFYSLCKDKI